MEEKNWLRRLISGEVLCLVTEEKAVDWLMTNSGQEYADLGLGYVGMQLASDEQQTYFYAAYDNLDDNTDAKALKSHLQYIVNLMHPLLAFLDFIAQANDDDQYADIEHIFRYSELITAIENSQPIEESLRALSSHSLFKTARSKSSLGEKLSSVLKTMEEEGFLLSDGSGSHFTVTGKLAYYIKLFEEIVQHQSPNLLEQSDDSQQELVV